MGNISFAVIVAGRGDQTLEVFTGNLRTLTLKLALRILAVFNGLLSDRISVSFSVPALVSTHLTHFSHNLISLFNLANISPQNPR